MNVWQRLKRVLSRTFGMNHEEMLRFERFEITWWRILSYTLYSVNFLALTLFVTGGDCLLQVILGVTYASNEARIVYVSALQVSGGIVLLYALYGKRVIDGAIYIFFGQDDDGRFGEEETF